MLDPTTGEIVERRLEHETGEARSLRMAMLHGKVKENPARAVRRKVENNEIVRYLAAEEDTRLRKAIRSNPSWAPHEPELSLALATGLRCGSIYRDLRGRRWIWTRVP
jgi:hypothetical protein